MAGTPVSKGMAVELDIDDLGHEGEGIGRYQGFTLFVPGALPGERVLARVEEVKKNFGRCRLVEITRPSPARVAPPCPVYERCGGCSLQHLAYESQLQWKRRRVEENLKRIGRIDHALVHPVIGMDRPWHYRNKVHVPFGEEKGELVGGFYAKGTHRIIEMESCLILHEQGSEVIRNIKKIAARFGIKGYDPSSGKGILRHVVVKTGFQTGEVMVILITNGEALPNEGRLVEEIRRFIPGVKSIIQNINTRKTNLVFGPVTRNLWGNDGIYDMIGDLKFALSPRSFFQVNPVQTRILYEKAVEYAGLSGKETVIDAYCGIGTISLFLAGKAKRVLGVEEIPEAVADARRNAELNRIGNAEFVVGKAEEVIPRLAREGMRADVIIVDPPRKGCEERLLHAMIEMKPERVVYVSCNPSTLARDLRILEDGGFRTVEVQPVDMFPQTSHVECVIWMDRND